MSETFRAIRISKAETGQSVDFVELTEKDLMEGDVTIAVEYSTINYKDGLALTGKAPIIRSWPLIPGIDFAGTVLTSAHTGFKPGDKVVLNGWGVGESHHGGYAQRARVKGDWLVKLPSSISTSHAMAVGTAGYTAMLCVMAIEKAGVAPGEGDVLVTGAAGGVGSVAVAVLAKLGYRVIASTGRANEAAYLRGLGAAEILDRAELAQPAKPLGKERWKGVVDVAGGNTLANAISATRYGGAVAACGLAESMNLPTFVTPFILRGVSLLGVDSVMAPRVKREEAWRRLATDLDLAKLDAMSERAGLKDLPSLAVDILAGKLRGRTIIDVNA